MAGGFFGGLFKKEEGSVTTTLDSVGALIEKEFLIQKRGLEDFSAKKIAEVKYLHNKASGLLAIVSEKELEAKTNERMNRAALTSKKQLAVQLLRLLAKLTPAERGNTIEDARHYSGESYALLANEINSLRKNIAYTSFYLKEDMKALGSSLQGMANIFHEMNLEFEKAGAVFDFEKTMEKIAEVKKSDNELKKIGEEISLLREKISQKERQLASQKSGVEERKAGSEMNSIREAEQEMAKLASEKQELKTEISALLLNIDRPLARFKQLVDSGRWKIPKDEKEMLSLFLSNPIFALKKDPRADVFKKVLGEVIKAVEEGEIELKEKEKEKRLGALQEIINFDFFGKVFWKMNELQKKQDSLNKLLERSETKKSIEADESKARQSEREIAEARDAIAQKEKLLEFTKTGMEKETQKIKEFAERVLKKKIVFGEEGY